MTAFFNTGLSRQQFLDQYWQKKPLLIRQVFPGFVSPLSAEELAGLACEEEIESRLIEEHGAEGPWQLRHGPFCGEDFSNLPPTHWTLLVQDVDKHVPDLASILEPFNFIPDWRRDDLMVSYAPAFGSVGPHTDGYDVFLLQAMGTRRWQISDAPVTEARLLDGLDLKILAEFAPDQTWELQPGDMLYLPPHYAHHGVALNNCMTFSVGFRAPTRTELLDALVNNLIEQGKGEKRYSDPTLEVTDCATEIDQQALQRFKQILLECIEESDEVLTTAIGRLVTETKPSLEMLADEFAGETCTETLLDERFAAGESLVRNRYLRFAWAAEQAVVNLFVAGEAYRLDEIVKPFMPLLTSAQEMNQIEWQQIKQQPQLVALLLQLIEQGGWYWSD